jgi:hypothetical protein
VSTRSSLWMAFGCMAAVAAVGTSFTGRALAAPVPFALSPSAGLATFANNRLGVRTVLVHGDTIYVGGNFRVTQGDVTRSNLAAFDFAGNLKEDFNAAPNGTVLALATDGHLLFVGGEFTRLDMKKRLAAVDLVTGKVDRRFRAHVSGVVDTELPTGVRALAVVTDSGVTPPVSRLIVGGNFTHVNSNAITPNRAALAALAPDSGELDQTTFTQVVQNGVVDALLATADALYVGGSFDHILGRSASLAALSASGQLLAGSFSSGGQPTIDLDIDPIGNRLFAGVGGGGNRVIAYVATGTDRGRRLWQGPKTGGDVQAVRFLDGNVYFGFHDGLFTEPDAYKLAVVDAATGVFAVDPDHDGLTCGDTPDLLPNCWLPQMDNTAGGQGFFGVWSIAALTDPLTGKASLIVGGDFTHIGDSARTRRLAIFTQP